MSNEAKRRRRLLAGVLAGALALSVTPILGFSGVASADHIEVADPIGDGNVCEDAPETDPFTDVADADSAVNEIRCMANTDPVITKGTTATTYSPTAPTERGQMALFLQRIADLAEANETSEDAVQALPAGDGTTPFTDIGDWSAEHQSAIDRLEEAGITDGVTATEFRPGQPVTRRQMARFIVNLQVFLAGEDFPPEPSEDFFDDDNGDFGEDVLNILAEEGVFIGVAGAAGTHNVQPGADITRRQMAFVVTRKLEVLFEAGLITRLFAEDDTNQAFGVDVAETTLVDSSDPNQDPVLTYTFSGLDPAGSYEVALFHCGSYEDDTAVKSDGQDYPNREGMSDGSGSFTFRDQDLDDIADNAGETLQGHAEIATIGFTAVGSQHASDVSAPNGTLLVRVTDADGGGDCAVPVIWQESGAGENDDLDLTPDTTNSWNTPLEPFAVGGAAVFHNGEAPTGYELNDWDVVFLNTAENFWVEWGEGYIMRYGRPGDMYHYDGNDADGFISPETFEELLSPGDYFSGSESSAAYSQAGNTTWSFSPEYPGEMVTNVNAVEGDFDSPTPDGDADDLRFTWTAPDPSQGLIDMYCVEYNTADLMAGWTDLDCTDEVNTLTPGDAPTTLTVTDHGLAADDYVFRVYSETENGNSGDSSLLSNVLTVAGPPGPTITSAELTTDAVTTEVADDGDVWTLTLSEALAALVDGDTISLTDADGDTIIAECDTAANGVAAGNSDADCALAGDELTVTLDADPVDRNAAGDGDIMYPLTITATSGLESSTTGVPVDVAGSADVTIG